MLKTFIFLGGKREYVNVHNTTDFELKHIFNKTFSKKHFDKKQTSKKLHIGLFPASFEKLK